MPIVRRSSSEIDRDKLLRELVKARVRSEEEIEAEAIEDGGALTDEELARMILVPAAIKPEAIRALRDRLGMTQPKFAVRFGFPIEALQEYEDDRFIPFGTDRILLRLLEVDADAVLHMLDPGPHEAINRLIVRGDATVAGFAREQVNRT